MRSLRIMGLVTLLVAASTAAWAFQEQQGGSSAPAAKAPVAGSQGSSGPVQQFEGGPAVAKPSGTEIRIPGLGSLGVLPKMDFGLELLYGASEQKSLDDSRVVAPGSDDVSIRGTFRRKF